MTAHTRRPLSLTATLLALALAVVALGATLAAPASAGQTAAAARRTTHFRRHARGARATKGRCSAGTTHTRGAHGARAAHHAAQACTRSGRANHLSRHGRRAAPARPKPAASPKRTLPVCEDGTAATVTPTGATCADGSEPSCEADAIPTHGLDGSVVACTPDPEAATEATEPACAGDSCPTTYSGEFDSSSCESGTGATLAEDGSFTCADGSEPGCADGTSLTLGGGGTVLVCEVTATPAQPGEASS